MAIIPVPGFGRSYRQSAIGGGSGADRTMASRGGKVGFWPLLVFWALGTAMFAAKAWFTTAITPLVLDSDDAMRLTEVHDFLGGQGWFDLVQHRQNTPYGATMHWSRLIDLPEATLLFLLRPFAGDM